MIWKSCWTPVYVNKYVKKTIHVIATYLDCARSNLSFIDGV